MIVESNNNLAKWGEEFWPKKRISLGGCSGSLNRAQLIRSWERERESGIVGWNIQKQLIRRQVRERERWMKLEGSSQVIWNPEANIMLTSTIQWFWMNEPPVFNYVRFVLFKADPLILIVFFPLQRLATIASVENSDIGVNLDLPDPFPLGHVGTLGKRKRKNTTSALISLVEKSDQHDPFLLAHV